MDTDLALAGLGLGLVIGPLTSAALRVVPAAQHGIASSAVVVARMTGMLVGVAALSAWGLYRFNQILQERLAAQPAPPRTDNPVGALAAGAARVEKASIEAFALQYGEIFGITAIVCVVGAVLGLLISGRGEHADDADPVTAEVVGRRLVPQQRSRPGCSIFELVALGGLGGAQHRAQRAAHQFLDCALIDWAKAEPVLQCSHAHRPLSWLPPRERRH